jgi:hypothetical protein
VSIALGLIDFDYGQWQGLSNQEVQDKYKELYAVWASHPERAKIPGGESLEYPLCSASRKSLCAVVSHLKTLVMASLDKPKSSPGIIRFISSPFTTIVLWNEVERNEFLHFSEAV